MNDIVKNPKTIKDLALEIIKVCDGYWSKQMTESEAKEFIDYWSINAAIRLFKGKEINPGVIRYIGKRRTEQVNNWLL